MLSMQRVMEEIGKPLKYDGDCATFTYYFEPNGTEWRIDNEPDENGKYEFAARPAGTEDWYTQGIVRA